MGLKVVTYEGSDNPNETVFFIGGSRLPKGVPTSIPDDDVKLLDDLNDDQKAEGHQFKKGGAAPKDAVHGSVVVDGELRAIVPQPAVAAAEAEAGADEPEAPAPTS